MRKLSTIKSLRHRLYGGTAALGCPRSEAPLCLKSSRSCGCTGVWKPYKFWTNFRLGKLAR
jgi:hypothetical protein